MEIDLQAVKQLLQSELNRAASITTVGDSIHIERVADPVDMTKDAADREVAVQLLDRESALARRLRSAISRIDGGSYGICQQCEEEISPKRLRAIPWAELCISCQEAKDSLHSDGGQRLQFEDWTEAA